MLNVEEKRFISFNTLVRMHEYEDYIKALEELRDTAIRTGRDLGYIQGLQKAIDYVSDFQASYNRKRGVNNGS